MKKTETIQHKEDKKTICYQEIACEWLKYSEFRLKASSYQKYRGILKKYLLPEFGTISIADMTTEKIGVFLASLRGPGPYCNQNGLTPQYINCILCVLREISRFSSSRGMPFPCDFHYLTQKVEKKECEVFTHEESVRLVKYLTEHMDRSRMGILLCFYTGMRLGELCALQWKDISLEEKLLKITHTMQRLTAVQESAASGKTSIIITEPKTPSSRREIPLPDFLLGMLETFSCSEKDAYFLSGRTDKMIEPRVMQYRFRKYTQESGVRPLNFHALRHTFATQCVEQDFELKSLSEILGHSSVNITLNRYVHSSRELKRRNMEKLRLTV